MALKRRIKEVQDALKAASLEGPEEAAAMAIGAETVGLDERYGFQGPSADPTGGIQPLSVDGVDYRTFEL